MWLSGRYAGLRKGINYVKSGEGNDIIRLFWQNIVIIVCIIIVILMFGKIIYDSMAKEADGADEVQEVKRAYLTFDDGPSAYTDEILDILAANDVKATFFVIGRDESYYDYYRRIVAEGHTLGLHSYSHEYSKIYSSLENFVRDIEDLRELVYDVTGVECIYYRFPGGSSNTVSQVPMTELVDYVEARGLVYFDWNALNGDSVSGELSVTELVDNVMKDATKYDDTVILMHDLEDRHTTVESLQLLIDELKAAGYEILPIDENTPLIRHTIS